MDKWVTEHEAEIRRIINTNCTLVGHLSDGRGNRCFWGSWLVEVEGWEDDDGSLLHPSLGRSFTARDWIGVVAPSEVVEHFMGVNDQAFDVDSRRLALHKAADGLIAEGW